LNGARVFDFHLPTNIFNNSENFGFCEENCLGNGVLDISKCYGGFFKLKVKKKFLSSLIFKIGAPSYISQPHFLNAGN
jgi:hypothetical protein